MKIRLLCLFAVLSFAVVYTKISDDVTWESSSSDKLDKNSISDEKTKEKKPRYAKEPCDPEDLAWYPVEDDPHKFLYCDAATNTLFAEPCAKIGDVRKIFDETYQMCLMPSSRVARQVAGSGRVSDVCQFNTDCLGGMYCSGGTCTCLSNYVARDFYCYAKINPSQGGCTYVEQCSSVWPGATCTLVGGSSTGTCQCPTNYVAAQTQDGYVCLDSNAITDPCPTPEGAGASTALQATTGTPISCTVGSSCPNTLGTTVGELYDCVTAVKVGTGGICCPSRAYTCIMPRAITSGTTAPETRWYYSSVTGTCEQFSWFPGTTTANNANNFRTRAHCETYCKDTCPRGRPSYTGTGTTNQQIPLSCAGTTSSCGTNYVCNTVGSFQYCCPSADSICSTTGGTQTTVTNFNAGFTAQNGGFAPGTRWYYDTTSVSCRPFQYLGAGGNYNNFASQADCQNFCQAVLCTVGTPIRDANGNYQQCSGNSNCPNTHSCTNSVCCPDAQTVCSQPKQLGTCGSFVTRYWYNALTKDCEQFVYSGCQGNDNAFTTLLSCQSFCRNVNPEPQCVQGSAYRTTNGAYYRCSNTGLGNVCPANYECYYDGFQYGCCPTQAYTCSLTYQVGAQCGVQSTRWYYDTSTQSCNTFTYTGCDGNSNNFPTRSSCEQYCGVGGCPYGGTAYREASNQLRVCSAAVTCPSGYECQLVTLSSSSQINYCCPTKAQICSLPPNAGGTQCNAQNSITRYYFNLASRQCTTFTFNGCEGNGNSFATMAQCQNFCQSAACEPGEIVFRNPNSLTTTTCNQALQSSCPNGYTCRFDSLTGNNVCCGGTSLGVCPTGENAYIEVSTQAARECRPNVAGTCPGNFLCRFNSRDSKYYCCSSASGRICPGGKAVYKDAGTNRQVICTLNNVLNVCPTGYSCQTAVVSSFQGYCCSINPICPNGGDYYAEPSGVNSGNPRACTVGLTGNFNTCPAGYTCQGSATGNTVGYCCTGSVSSVCGSLLAYQINNSPVVCQAGSTNGCPSGYSCQLYSPTNTYYCCQASSGVCGNDQPYIQNNFPLQCQTGNVNNCPTGYSCRQFGTSGTYYCCLGQGSDGCPPGTTSSPTNPTCAINQVNSCPFGYSCQFSGTNARYQCCGTGGGGPITSGDGCPNGQIGSLQGGAGVETCALGQFNSCPTGYSCQYSSQFSRYQCCGINAGCPGSSVAFISTSGQPQSCVAGGFNSCPAGFVCQQTSTGGTACCTGSAQPTTCGVNQVLFNGQCLQQVPAGQPCSTQAQCLGGSVCQNNVCTLQQQVTQATCPIPGQRVYMLPNTAQAQTCSPGFNSFNSVCPSGYTCQYSPSSSSYVCCGGLSVPSQTCPAGSTPYVSSINSQPQTCTGNFYGCPSGYTCQYSSVLRQYYCCSSTSPNPIGTGCPNGLAAYTVPGRNTPQQCSPNSLGCPGGFTCTYSTTTFRYICCGALGGGGVIPSQTCIGSCVPNAINTGCSNGYTCQQRGNTYQCCSGFGGNGGIIGAGTNGCTSGNAYIYPGTNSPLACQPNGNSRCPAGYSCSYSSINGNYQCCSGFASKEPNKAEQRQPDSVKPHHLNETLVQPKPALGIIPSTDHNALFSYNKPYGAECNSDEECQNSCAVYKGKKICKCPSNKLLHFSRYRTGSAQCTSSCNGRNDNGVCVNAHSLVARDDPDSDCVKGKNCSHSSPFS